MNIFYQCTVIWVYLHKRYSVAPFIFAMARKEKRIYSKVDRSFHFGTQEYKIIGMISHLGPQLGIADGIALANKLRKNEK